MNYIRSRENKNKKSENKKQELKILKLTLLDADINQPLEWKGKESDTRRVADCAPQSQEDVRVQTKNYGYRYMHEPRELYVYSFAVLNLLILSISFFVNKFASINIKNSKCS